MSLSPFSFISKRIENYQQWFVDIFNHLSAKNYDNGDWTPVITGITGSPTVTAWFQRWGIECNVFINIEGTHDIDGGEISLPLTPLNNGIVFIHSITDNSFLGQGYIDSSLEKIKIKRYFVTDETVIIYGKYKVEGI